jgi:predicted RNase H-related nuclease YkuK (DUF458 family)
MLFDFDVIRDFINKQSPQTRIYIGVDSERVKIDDAWHAIYTAAIERNSWKKMMISAELTAATQPKTRDRQDARPQEPAALPE